MPKTETELNLANFGNAPYHTPQRQDDKMPSEQFSGFSFQNSQEKLVKTERARENKPEENWIIRREGNKVHLKTERSGMSAPIALGRVSAHSSLQNTT